tara:strand:+ start:862 stop:1170 length:309 start_codon:yes stop_codon:yes gene_type:complete
MLLAKTIYCKTYQQHPFHGEGAYCTSNNDSAIRKKCQKHGGCAYPMFLAETIYLRAYQKYVFLEHSTHCTSKNDSHFGNRDGKRKNEYITCMYPSQLLEYYV